MASRQELFNLNRPQYVASPDDFLSALAWREHEWPDREPATGRVRGLAYVKEGPGPSAWDLVTTYPAEDVTLTAFARSLGRSSIDPRLSDAETGRAFADAVLGIKAKKATVHPAGPLTVHLALLQDRRGAQGARNPPDLAVILEEMFRMGLPRGVDSPRPSRMWVEAAVARTEQDPVLRDIDHAVRDALLPGDIIQQPGGPVSGALIAVSTPFTWFVRSWRQLTSVWSEVLPARVWVDWCSTALRMVFGCGFLWEASYFEQYARALIRGDNPSHEVVAESIDELLPWPPSDAQMGVRDVGSLLRTRIKRADAVRRLLTPDEHAGAAALQDALADPGTAGRNTWEAVRYALLVRDQSGRYADHYGLLQSRGRWTFVAPGVEWITVIASLAAGGPGKTTDANNVMQNLHELGLYPELRDLILLLESAGLTRGSADADYGLEVRSAY